MSRALNKEGNILDLTNLLARVKPSEKASFEFSFDENSEFAAPYKFVGAGLANLEARLDGDQIKLVGEIRVPMEFVCSKCGVSFEENLFVEVNEILTSEFDQEHFVISANKVDLDDIVNQLVIVNIPSRVLCKDNCLGVCSNCGKNLNEGACDCKIKFNEDNPFVKLADKFK
ncbi:MAG: DUF177 domain-containing protein [bacterium]|nr:DUF177 domain-containing protein [bacterium]